MRGANFSTAAGVFCGATLARNPIRARAISAFCAAVCGMLTACATTRDTAPPDWQAPNVKAHARAWVCRLIDDCQQVRIRLIDTDAPSATLWFGMELTLSRGLYLATESETELVFVLAHELGHRRLRHSPPRDIAKRLPLELAADRWAIDRLCALGLDPASGQALVRRFLEAERQLADARKSGPNREDDARSAIAIRELDARQVQDFGCEHRVGAAKPPSLDAEMFETLRAAASVVPSTRW